MKIGDIVKIKSYDKIKSHQTNSDSYGGFYSDNLLFDLSMKQYCNSTVTITKTKQKSYGIIYRVKECGWWWHEKWLIANFLSDEDFEL